MDYETHRDVHTQWRVRLSWNPTSSSERGGSEAGRNTVGWFLRDVEQPRCVDEPPFHRCGSNEVKLFSRRHTLFFYSSCARCDGSLVACPINIWPLTCCRRYISVVALGRDARKLEERAKQGPRIGQPPQPNRTQEGNCSVMPLRDPSL